MPFVAIGVGEPPFPVPLSFVAGAVSPENASGPGPVDLIVEVSRPVVGASVDPADGYSDDIYPFGYHVGHDSFDVCVVVEGIEDHLVNPGRHIINDLSAGATVCSTIFKGCALVVLAHQATTRRQVAAAL